MSDLDDGLVADEELTATATAPSDAQLAAQAALSEAIAAVEAVDDELAAARDAVADATDSVQVAAAKADHYDGDDGKVEWQRLEARQAVDRARRAQGRARGKVDSLEAKRARAQEGVARASAALRAATPGGGESGGEDGANHFPTVYAFVDEYLAHVYATEIREQIGHVKWCARWWEHTEAMARLTALWQAFEVLRLEPGTGMSVWFRDHADPCMSALMNAQGTFGACPAGHQLKPALPVEPAPTWLREREGSTADGTILASSPNSVDESRPTDSTSEDRSPVSRPL